MINICTISFLSCYDIGCIMFRNMYIVLLISDLAKKWTHCAETYFLDSGYPKGRGFVHAWA